MIQAIAIDDEPLALKVIESHCGKTDVVNLQKTFTHPTEALNYLKNFPVDLLFVDIQMPSMSGINLVKALPQKSMVIFTTAFSEYAVTSYELNAIDYLLKPISLSRFNTAITKAKEFFDYTTKQSPHENTHIFIRADFSLIKISIADILYIEGLADYVKICIKNKKTIVARITMKEMLEKLPNDKFIRIHRSFIVPFDSIESVRNNILVVNQKEFPIGKTYIDEFNSRYKK